MGQVKRCAKSLVITKVFVSGDRPVKWPKPTMARLQELKLSTVNQTRSLGDVSGNAYLYRVLEDGSQTQMRLAIIESAIPPKSDGPVMHLHEMHDEGFIITKGQIRFHTPGAEPLDAKVGDIITVPPRVPHKFSNPFDGEAIFLNTITPGFFVRYFEALEEMIGDGKILTPEINMAALRRFATVPLDEQAILNLIAESKENGTSGEEIDL